MEKSDKEKEMDSRIISHKLLMVMWQYLTVYAKKNKLNLNDVNLFEQLNLPYPAKYSSALEYYTDMNLWTTIDIYTACYLKLKEITGEPTAYRNCGRFATKSLAFLSTRKVTKAIFGITEVVNYSAMMVSEWQKAKTFKIIKPATKNKSGDEIDAIFKYTYNQDIDPCDVYCGDEHMIGTFENMSTNVPISWIRPWNRLPMGSVQMLIMQYEPIKLYSGKFFEHLKLEPHYNNHSLYICDPNTNSYKKVGHKVILESTIVNHQAVFLGKNRPFLGQSRTDEFVGTLITETVSYKGEIICEAGVILNGPYFLFTYNCKTTKQSYRKGRPLSYVFTSKKLIWEGIDQLHLHMQREIAEKHKALEELKCYIANQEIIIKERTEQLKQSMEYIRKLDQIIIHVVSHGIGNWAANTIADTNILKKKIKESDYHEYIDRLLINSGIATLASMGLNYYCDDNAFVKMNNIIDGMQNQAQLYRIIDFKVDENVRELLVDSKVLLIISEMVQNAVKAQINQGIKNKIFMHIYSIENMVTIMIANRGTLNGIIKYIQDNREELPEKHKGILICKKLVSELDGKIYWSEDNGSVIAHLVIPIKNGTYYDKQSKTHNIVAGR